jgi:hypothetical protein
MLDRPEVVSLKKYRFGRKHLMRRCYPAAVGDTSNAGSDKVFVEKKRHVQSGLMRGIEKEGRADCVYRPSPHAG